jgi:hypothetical protein
MIGVRGGGGSSFLGANPLFLVSRGIRWGLTLQFGGSLCDVADQAMIELCTLLIAFAMRVLSFHFMVNSSWLPDG